MSTTTEPNVPQAAPPAVPPTPGSHIADPGALGLGAFALTTFVLSVVNAGWVPETVEPAVFGLALAYGGIAQLVAGIWEFTKGNTFGATAFCSYAGFWLAFWWLTGHTDMSAAGDDAGKGTGLFLLAWGIFSLLMLIASIRMNTVLLITFILLTITFFLLSIGDFSGATGLNKAGGYVGILTALCAWYGCFATVVNFTFKRAVLPVGARG